MAEPPSDKPAWRENAQEWIETGLARVGVDLAEFRNALMPFDEAFDWNAEETVQAAIPGANGQFTARSLARVYAMLAEGGEIDGVRLVSRERLVELSRVENRGRDRVLMIPMHWRLGYHRAFTLGKTAPDAFGHYGYGGSGAFCDPSRRLAVALTVNTGSGTPAGDWRMPRLARAAIGRRRPHCVGGSRRDGCLNVVANALYQGLEERFRTIGDLRHAEAMLSWDEAVMMPSGGGKVRADALAALAGTVHSLEAGAGHRGTGQTPRWRRKTTLGGAPTCGRWRGCPRRARALPEDLVTALTRASAASEQAWRDGSGSQ